MNIKKFAIFTCAVILTVGFVFCSMAFWKGTVPSSNGNFDSPNLNARLKAALLGDGIIELDEKELNGMASAFKKGRIEELYMDIEEERLLVTSMVKALGRDFFLKCQVKPYVLDGRVRIDVEKVEVGKVNLPSWLVMSMAKRYLPEDLKVVEGGTIEVSGGMFVNGIEDMALGGDRIRIILLQEFPDFALDSDDEEEFSAAPDLKVEGEPIEEPYAEGEKGQVGTSLKESGDKEAEEPAPQDGGSSPPPQGEEPKTELKPAPEAEEKMVSALELTNGQLYGVLSDVKDSSGKSWVRRVISVNSRMIKDPGRSYKGDISSTKAAYKSLSADVKREIQKAALGNLDIAAVRYLVKVYGI